MRKSSIKEIFGYHARSIFVIEGIASVIASLFCAIANYDDRFGWLFLLPLISFLVYMAYSVTVKKGEEYAYQNLLATVILFFYFIRNVFSPIILVLDNYTSKYRFINESDVRTAVLVLSYETIIVALFLKFKIYRKLDSSPRSLRFRFGDISTAAFGFILLAGVGICAIALVRSADLREVFYSIFTSNFYEVGGGLVDKTTMGGNRIWYTSGKMLINSVRLILPGTIITLLAKKKTLARLHLCMLIAGLQVFFMTDGNAYVIVLVLVQLVYIYLLFPSQDKIILTDFAIILALLIALIALHRFLNPMSAFSSSFSAFLQSYFPGVCGTAGGVKMIKNYTGDKLPLFIEDFYSNVPFRSTLFGYSGDDLVLANVLNSINASGKMICPTVIECAFYFGYIFVPVYSCIFISVAFRYLRKLQHETNGLRFLMYLLIMVISAMTPVCYDMRIFIRYFTNFFFWMWIFAVIADHVPSLQVDVSGEQDEPIMDF